MGDKTLCEVLTVADAILLPMAGPRVDTKLSRHGSVQPFSQLGGNRTLGWLPQRSCHAVPMQASSGPKTMLTGCLHVPVSNDTVGVTPQRR